MLYYTHIFQPNIHIYINNNTSCASVIIFTSSFPGRVYYTISIQHYFFFSQQTLGIQTKYTLRDNLCEEKINKFMQIQCSHFTSTLVPPTRKKNCSRWKKNVNCRFIWNNLCILLNSSAIELLFNYLICLASASYLTLFSAATVSLILVRGGGKQANRRQTTFVLRL